MNKVKGAYSGHNHFSNRNCTNNSHVSYLQRSGSFCYGNINMHFCLSLKSTLKGIDSATKSRAVNKENPNKLKY